MIRNLALLAVMAAIFMTTTYASAEGVYVTKNGKRYHKEICRLIKNKKPVAIEKEQALKKVLTPCGLCFKDELSLEKKGK